MSEFLREENMAPAARLHWVINNGGDIPNVTPEIAEISYYVREEARRASRCCWTR
ncbi:hypothetical protein ACFQ0Q_10380 [Streptomyces aureus]